MKKCWKLKISRVLGCNIGLNRKVICLKHSWDEVEALISKGNKCKPK